MQLKSYIFYLYYATFCEKIFSNISPQAPHKLPASVSEHSRVLRELRALEPTAAPPSKEYALKHIKSHKFKIIIL